MSNQNQNNAVMCVVKSNPSAPVPSKFNGAMRQSIHVMVGQEAIQLWENCPCLISTWSQGQTQYVRKNHRGFYESVESYGEAHAPQVVAHVAPQATPQVRSSVPSADVRFEAAEYCKFQIAMYRGIFEEVQKSMQSKGLDVSLEKDIATTIFIQANKRFSM